MITKFRWFYIFLFICLIIISCSGGPETDTNSLSALSDSNQEVTGSSSILNYKKVTLKVKFPEKRNVLRGNYLFDVWIWVLGKGITPQRSEFLNYTSGNYTFNITIPYGEKRFIKLLIVQKEPTLKKVYPLYIGEIYLPEVTSETNSTIELPLRQSFYRDENGLAHYPTLNVYKVFANGYKKLSSFNESFIWYNRDDPIYFPPLNMEVSESDPYENYTLPGNENTVPVLDGFKWKDYFENTHIIYISDLIPKSSYDIFDPYFNHIDMPNNETLPWSVGDEPLEQYEGFSFPVFLDQSGNFYFITFNGTKKLKRDLEFTSTYYTLTDPQELGDSSLTLNITFLFNNSDKEIIGYYSPQYSVDNGSYYVPYSLFYINSEDSVNSTYYLTLPNFFDVIRIKEYFGNTTSLNNGIFGITYTMFSKDISPQKTNGEEMDVSMKTLSKVNYALTFNKKGYFVFLELFNNENIDSSNLTISKVKQLDFVSHIHFYDFAFKFLKPLNGTIQTLLGEITYPIEDYTKYLNSDLKLSFLDTQGNFYEKYLNSSDIINFWGSSSAEINFPDFNLNVTLWNDTDYIYLFVETDKTFPNVTCDLITTHYKDENPSETLDSLEGGFLNNIPINKFPVIFEKDESFYPLDFKIRCKLNENDYVTRFYTIENSTSGLKLVQRFNYGYGEFRPVQLTSVDSGVFNYTPCISLCFNSSLYDSTLYYVFPGFDDLDPFENNPFSEDGKCVNFSLSRIYDLHYSNTIFYESDFLYLTDYYNKIYSKVPVKFAIYPDGEVDSYSCDISWNTSDFENCTLHIYSWEGGYDVGSVNNTGTYPVSCSGDWVLIGLCNDTSVQGGKIVKIKKYNGYYSW